MTTKQVGMVWFIVAAELVLSACNEADSNGSSSRTTADGRVVIGNLGGVPVRIPIEFAESVEYDDDPAILQPRLMPTPTRTLTSKLRSFGFYARYPDMIGPASEEARKDRAAHLPGNTFWISVGLKAGEDYPGAGATHRLTTATLANPDSFTKAPFQLATEKTCGLETYVLAGNDLRSGKPIREDSDARDVFVSRDAAGQATTFIRCSNRPLSAAPCTQHFDLEPQMHALAYISFRRGLLCEWRGIQSAASQLIFSFKAMNEPK
jgi:hypothetical protein